MIKFKVTLWSGTVVERFALSMVAAITEVEFFYETTVIKCERIFD